MNQSRKPPRSELKRPEGGQGRRTGSAAAEPRAPRSGRAGADAERQSRSMDGGRGSFNRNDSGFEAGSGRGASVGRGRVNRDETAADPRGRRNQPAGPAAPSAPVAETENGRRRSEAGEGPRGKTVSRTPGERYNRGEGYRDESTGRPVAPRGRGVAATGSRVLRNRDGGQSDIPVAKPVEATEGRRRGRDLRPENLPVERARKMVVRAGSEKLRAQEQQLREKRIEAHHVAEVRLQKALSLSGVGSRRDCDQWVAEGRVSINGRVALPGSRVKPGDQIRFDGKPINIKWPDRLPRVVIYHKQEGELVSRDDPEGRTTVFERLPKLQSSAWVAIGRLDFNTSGLLVFTTSGDFANRMMHPRFEVQREYAVRVLGQLTDEQLKQLKTGIQLEDGEARFDNIEEQGGEGKNHWYRVILREGRNREVRRMFEHFDITVSRLMRVRFGVLTLPSRLKRGQWYELSESEVLGVMKWAGLGLSGREAQR